MRPLVPVFFFLLSINKSISIFIISCHLSVTVVNSVYGVHIAMYVYKLIPASFSL